MFATQQKSQRSSLHSLDTLLWKITQPDVHHFLACMLFREKNTRQKIEVKPCWKTKTNAIWPKRVSKLVWSLNVYMLQLWHFMTHCSVCQCTWLCRNFEPLWKHHKQGTAIHAKCWLKQFIQTMVGKIKMKVFVKCWNLYMPAYQKKPLPTRQKCSAIIN